MKGYFITGTGTGVGKTFVTCALAQRAREAGREVFAFKPIETGCETVDGELTCNDQQLLWEASGRWQEGDLRSLYQQISFVSLVALDELMTVGGEKGDSLPLIETLQDTGTADPVAAFESEEMKRILFEAINKLPDREKIVVTLYYYEGLTLAEIGQVLGVTESRICQMHTKAVLQLRSRMSDNNRRD